MNELILLCLSKLNVLLNSKCLQFDIYFVKFGLHLSLLAAYFLF